MLMEDDRELARAIIKAVDNLSRKNDAVGDRRLRHAIDRRLVEIRLLVRDGHLRNMNGGRGPSSELGD